MVPKYPRIFRNRFRFILVPKYSTTPASLRPSKLSTPTAYRSSPGTASPRLGETPVPSSQQNHPQPGQPSQVRRDHVETRKKDTSPTLASPPLSQSALPPTLPPSKMSPAAARYHGLGEREEANIWALSSSLSTVPPWPGTLSTVTGKFETSNDRAQIQHRAN